MKANQKIMNKDDEAVSPVIAVILMVAITVVLAATVYVWVSGFGSQSSQPAKAIGLNSAGSIGTSGSPATYFKNYTISSASPGMKYSDMTVTLNGATLTFDSNPTPLATNETWGAGAGATDRALTDVVTAGDTFQIRSASSLSGATLRVLDAGSNSVLYTITLS